MTGKIEFRYDGTEDIVIATPHWKIETQADVFEWYNQYAVYLKRFDHKMDCIVVLDDFAIEPSIGSLWGEYRAKLLKELVRFNYRVHSNPRVQLFVNTSGVRHDVARDEAATVEEAIEAIKAARRAAGA